MLGKQVDRAILIDTACSLLGREHPGWDQRPLDIEPVVPDGSCRCFYRIKGPGQKTFFVITPPSDDANGMAEARSFYTIGCHLLQHGVPVPAIHGFDPASGLMVCEDLGSTSLFDCVTSGASKSEQVITLYEQVVSVLPRMQVVAAEGFDGGWCWDTPQYDRHLMLTRESEYFLQACCVDFLGLRVDRAPLERDFRNLAEHAAAAPAHYFLHRDFQSRNIMIKEGRVRIIDFQGGRLGPLGYDLASLLIDPYVGLTVEQQQYLIALYLDNLQTYIPYDRVQFHHEYRVLALQRNLQILGAFAFLSRVRQKPFFLDFIKPALQSLDTLLAKVQRADYPALCDLTQQCMQAVLKR